MSLIGSRIGRFRIEGLLGTGGMGHVYRGFDEILGRKAALKAAGEKKRLSALEKTRFLREARVLSRLDHPNICRIYDLVERHDTDFLVLELIEGQTLKEALRSGMDAPLKIEVAETIATVLVVAHREGIVHRDLKPENVMLTEENAIKVLDFGLARSLKDEEEIEIEALAADQRRPKPPMRRRPAKIDPTHTDASFRTTFGSIVGTVRYMSPEQARCEDATPASDLYSLGILMYEMFTGKRAYAGRPAIPALLYKVGRAEFRPLAELDAKLDPDLAQLIGELLQLDPAKRPTAEETLSRLRIIRKKPQRARRKRWMLTGVAAFLLVAFGLAFWVRSWLDAPTLIPADERERVVLLPFLNDTGKPDYQWVEWGLRGLVADTMTRSADLQLIPASSVREALDQAPLAPDQPPPREDVAGFLKALGANVLVRTVVEEKQDEFQVRFAVYNFAGLHVARAFRGPNLMKTAGSLGGDLIGLLKPGEPSDRPEAMLSQNEMASSIYAMGMQQFNTAGPKVAQDFFMVCLALDPDFHWARFWLAECYRFLGKPEESKVLTTEVFESGGIESDPVLKLSCIRTLSTLSADLGNWSMTEQLLGQAFAIAERTGRPLEMSGTLLQMGVQAFRKGELDRAAQLLERAHGIYREQGHLSGEGSVLMNLGNVADERRDWAAAETYYHQALDIFEEIHHQPRKAQCLTNLGVLAYNTEKLDAAEDYYRRALTSYRELAWPELIGISINNLAGVALGRGDFEKAETMLLEAMAIFERLGNKDRLAMTSYNLAELLVTRKNDPVGAEPYLERARAWYRDDPDVLLLACRHAYAMGRVAESLSLAQQAKRLAEDRWTESEERVLGAVVQAERTGNRPPLPVD